MLERILLPIIALLMAVGLINHSLIQSDAAPSHAALPSAPWATATPNNPTSTYRHTNKGWEDSTRWRINGEESKVQFIDNVHPLVWSLMLVLVVYGLAILVSDEKHVRRLWSTSESTS